MKDRDVGISALSTRELLQGFWAFVRSRLLAYKLGTSGFTEEVTKAEKHLEMPTLNWCVLLKTTHSLLMALVFRKVESRTTDRFKCIISQLMWETESLAKSVFDEIGTIIPGEINLILYPLHLGIAVYCSLVSFCILLSSGYVKTISRGCFLIIGYSRTL